MRLPSARGPHSEAVIACLKGSTTYPGPWTSTADVLDDGDFQISLWMLYELHYAGFDDAAPELEWDPRLLSARHDLERHGHAAIQKVVEPHLGDDPDPAELPTHLATLVDGWEGASLAGYLARHSTPAEVRDLLAERSILQLKEADPYSWVIPRLSGPAKVALVELQFDEYGVGDPARLHQELYAQTLRECGLDPGYGAYIDDASPQMLALTNAASYFGLHRRLRGAAMGHLAAFEATSSLPSRKYAAALRKAGFSDRAALYFDEHVEADAVHEQLAIRRICGSLAAQEPVLVHDILFGAVTCLLLDDRLATALLDRWHRQSAPVT